MNIAAQSIAHLRVALGEDAENLQYVPINKVQSSPQDRDLSAVSFMIEYGLLRDKESDQMRQVWVLLYPPQRSGGYFEIGYHSFGVEAKDDMRYDPDNIGKIITDFSMAFRYNKGLSRAKHVALVKYYFLLNLAEKRHEGDDEKLRVGFRMSKSFIVDLGAACRQFKEEARTISRFPARTPIADSYDNNCQGNDLSGIASRSFEHDQAIRVGIRPDENRGASVLPIAEDINAIGDTAAQALFSLDESEDKIMVEKDSIDKQIAALQKRRGELDVKNENIASRRQSLLLSMDSNAAYRLGRSTERARTAKR